MITTFEDEPYRAPFSGNVIELCPVGALTSTQYRFEARPWDIQEVPTVCGLCPVGCNTAVTTREGQAKRVRSRNHPEIDGGWLCDKGRFAGPHLYADDRITEPLRRDAVEGLAAVDWDDALDTAERLLRESSGRIVTALSGSETSELAFALGQAAARGARRPLRGAARVRVVRARRVSPAAVRDRGRRARRGRRRRSRRRARPDRRPLAAPGASRRRRDRHDRAVRQRARAEPGTAADALRHLTDEQERRRHAAPVVRARDPDLVGPGWRWRRTRRRGCARARVRRKARLRGVPPSRRPRTDAASPRPGRALPTRTRRTPNRSVCCSSRVTTPPPMRPCGLSPSAPSA